MSTTLLEGSNDIITRIRKWKTVRVSTGNIQRHPELFRRTFKDSAEELLDAIAFQLDESNGLQLELKSDGTITLVRDAENCRLSNVDRGDMKLTLKVCLSSLDAKQVEESVDATLREISLKSISQLIIAFPPGSHLNIDPADPSQVQLWLSQILPFWRQLETLVRSRKVVALGVADLDYEQLKALYESSNDLKPMVDHYSTEKCCKVPEELREYAKEKDILLLTHNDPQLCNISEKLKIATRKLFGDEEYILQWSARYTIWLRSRSVIGAKGYILQFQKSIHDNNGM